MTILLTRDIEFIIAEVKTEGYLYSVIRQHDDVIRKHWQLI
ncbi:hypothetical protein T4D_16459 [Trichinella pseudospiralis]|uniref:Uncharacterized protein n=1 Tax=Trichinella pseudospiralis TaxID=6337 RepID=A0A0V1DWJ5_TRIPS|nr:hypothetical protein T4D_16459 [Trichinella pseudospiralis]